MTSTSLRIQIKVKILLHILNALNAKTNSFIKFK